MSKRKRKHKKINIENMSMAEVYAKRRVMFHKDTFIKDTGRRAKGTKKQLQMKRACRGRIKI